MGRGERRGRGQRDWATGRSLLLPTSSARGCGWRSRSRKLGVRRARRSKPQKVDPRWPGSWLARFLLWKSFASSWGSEGKRSSGSGSRLRCEGGSLFLPEGRPSTFEPLFAQSSLEERLLVCLFPRSRRRTSFGRHRGVIVRGDSCQSGQKTRPFSAAFGRADSGGKNIVQVWHVGVWRSFHDLGDGTVEAG